MVISRWLSVAALATSVLTGCDVRGPEVGSGGVDFPDAGDPGADAAAGASCPSGLYVVNTNFQESSTVSILDSEANVLSETFVSSASGSVGLSVPLSDDVYVPTQPVSTAHVVLLDSKLSVVNWVNVRTPELQSQVRVSSGFSAYPHDYVEVPGGRAYVTRFGANRAPGNAPFDSGNDVAIVDLEAEKLVGTISFEDALEGVASEYLARPDTLVRVGRYVYVLLNMSTGSYEPVDGRLAVVDTQTDTVVGVLELSGLANCVGIALSPSQATLAITCSGTFDGDYYGFEQSALVLVDIDGPRLAERARWGARELGAGPLGFYASFATETLVAVTTFPRVADTEPNYVETLLTLHTESGSAEILLEAAQLYTFGHVECLPGCGDCFLADTGREGGVLHQFRVTGDHLELAGRIRVDRTTGLPPWAIGVLR